LPLNFHANRPDYRREQQESPPPTPAKDSASQRESLIAAGGWMATSMILVSLRTAIPKKPVVYLFPKPPPPPEPQPKQGASVLAYLLHFVWTAQHNEEVVLYNPAGVDKLYTWGKFGYLDELIAATAVVVIGFLLFTIAKFLDDILKMLEMLVMGVLLVVWALFCLYYFRSSGAMPVVLILGIVGLIKNPWRFGTRHYYSFAGRRRSNAGLGRPYYP
jgi:hypothetical protein